MFATFTDWSMDVPEEGVKTASEIWPEMQAAGALSMRIVKTDDTGARSMTMWPDEETAHRAIHAMRAKGAAKSGGEIIGSAMGTVLAEFG
ncbi:MAG: hypothetical protein CML52_05270 [Rhodobacteraceae bacterium]|jgi:hypothetical protein|nr:hypothetical protein [Paracoccaceae bacterium]